MIQAQYVAHTLEETYAVACLLTSSVAPPYVVALTGELGSGKTAFVQAMAQSLGITQPVQSPTFTLVNEYHFASGRLIHADLYRLANENEAKELGLSDYFTASRTITAVEWADKYPSLFPPATLWIRLESLEDHRVITLSSEDETLWHTIKMGAV